MVLGAQESSSAAFRGAIRSVRKLPSPFGAKRQEGGRCRSEVSAEPIRAATDGGQSNRLETDASLLIRRIASPSSGAMEMVRILAQAFIASVAWMESVTTMDFSLEFLM